MLLDERLAGSLLRKLAETWDLRWRAARLMAVDALERTEPGIDDVVPAGCPWTIEQVLSRSGEPFWPVRADR